jgi:hypothetical protein
VVDDELFEAASDEELFFASPPLVSLEEPEAGSALPVPSPDGFSFVSFSEVWSFRA